MNEQDFFRQAWRRAAGLPEEESPKPLPDLDSLKASEWSAECEILMRNRLVMGAIRYGALHAQGKPTYDRIKSTLRRLQRYAETGNRELLVDVANLCLLEFEEGDHPNGHWRSEDDGEHVGQSENQSKRIKS
jgi:hypothetical protein